MEKEKGNLKYRVLGIDPGLQVTGYAAVDFGGDVPVMVEAGAIRTDGGTDLAERVRQIHADLVELLAELMPDVVAIEDLYAHYKHPRTSILMGHARGVILLAAQQAGTAIKNLPATTIKKSLTGNGHASKRQMQYAIRTEFKLAKLPEPADVADALAVALCAGRRVTSAGG
ncbi:MAG: crossover junction endodeoxyribonuclease RuvC [Planctomycetes bacterium]|nr:crossover junction endodeoxyribonuclease RuvC [Planctomycetota bacterium]